MTENFGAYNGSPGNGAPSSQKKRIVILGSSYAGAQCARSIQEKLGPTIDLTVIDRRKAIVHKIAAARAAVCGNSYSDRVLIPNDNLVPQEMGRVVRGIIRQVTDHEVLMEDGVRIGFDFLVCATGAANFSICEPPLRYSDRASMKKFYDKVHKKIRSSERILIVGGGAVGVELAGEIKFEYNNKVVTIVHSGDRLLSGLRPYPGRKFNNRLRARLEEAGVTVLTSQKIIINWQQHGNKPYISTPGVEYTTDKGRKVRADLVLLCAGKKITNSMYPQQWLNDSGTITVKRTLQIFNHNNIFCIGDLNDVYENKQAVFAARQGKVAAENINRLVNNRSSLKKYKAGFGLKKTFIFVGVGRRKGVGHLGVFTVGSFFLKRIKTIDLFTKQYWKLYNLADQVPSEVGGPSRGNKLGTVARAPNLMMNDGGVYNNVTRSIEIKPNAPADATGAASRVQSVESVTSLADMYNEDVSSTNSNLLQPGNSNNSGLGTQAAQRDGMVSFVGSLDGSTENKHSILKPMSKQEYVNTRKATLERSNKQKNKQNQAGNFNQVPVPHGGTVLNKISYGQKPNRNEVISFVGAAPIKDEE